MIPMVPLLLSIGCAGLCGALGLPALIDQMSQASNRMRLKGRVGGGEVDRDEVFSVLLRNGVVLFRPLSKLLLRIDPIVRFCGKLVKLLRIKGHNTSVKVILELLMLFAVLIFASIFLLSGMWLVSVFVAIGLLFLITAKVNKAYAGLESRFVEQIPEALRALGICFGAGFSLQQAFEQVSLETEDPLGAELRQASYDISAGKSVNEALAALESRTNAEDLRFAIVALEIQHRCGGSLKDILDNAADAVVSSVDLRRQLGVQTAQARLSAKVVTVLPLVLVAALSLAMEGYLAAFFSSFEGLMILFVAVAMEIVGIVLIRKILGVNLG